MSLSQARQEGLFVFAKGMAMGMADIVPGVSGGTIAFITGIYPRLIDSLRSFDVNALQMLLQWRIAELWQRVDATFLLQLVAGILCSIFALAHLVHFLLDTYPVLIWSFFLGLISCSVFFMLKRETPKILSDFFVLIIGISVVIGIANSPAGQITPTYPVVFVAGMFTISAMLLPGISGSFLLLLVGLYQPTLEAVKSLDVLYVLSFGAGAAIGFISFSHFVHWLLSNFYHRTLMFLIGLLLGSLYVLWPWRALDDGNVPVLPSTYEALGHDPMQLIATTCVLVGVVLFLLLEKLSGSGNRDGSLQS